MYNRLIEENNHSCGQAQDFNFYFSLERRLVAYVSSWSLTEHC